MRAASSSSKYVHLLNHVIEYLPLLIQKAKRAVEEQDQELSESLSNVFSEIGLAVMTKIINDSDFQVPLILLDLWRGLPEMSIYH